MHILDFFDALIFFNKYHFLGFTIFSNLIKFTEIRKTFYEFEVAGDLIFCTNDGDEFKSIMLG